MRRRLSYDQFVQKRLQSLSVIFIVLYILIGLRLLHIQVICGNSYSAKAESFRLREIPLPAKRGSIYDRNGVKLATTVLAYDIFAHPSKMAGKDRQAAAGMLSGLLGTTPDTILAQLNTGKTFVFVRRRADARIGLAVKKAKIPGLEATSVMTRVYPEGTMAANVIGFTNIDGVGIEGLEKAFDPQLRGKDGYVVAEVDARGKVIPGTRRRRVEPVDGMDIYLTLDATLQHALDMELAKTFTERSAAGASAVMMDPATGEIIALSNMPTYDPNDVAQYPAECRRNRAVTDLYEPGSTLKTITACAGLEDKAITPADLFHCHGSMVIGRRTVRCSLHPPFMAGHGACDCAKMLKYSCNMAAAGIGLRLGKERLHKYEQAFGLYEKPGTGMPGEMMGWRDRWEDWPDVRVANIAFGQGIAVTPLQMAVAYGTVANEGVMMQAHIIKEIRNSDGVPVRIFGRKRVRRVVSDETARMVSNMLQGVVDEGTGKPANVEGYRIAGKTGSAQKASTTGRGYAAGRFIASFIGFLPITNPRVVILVVVDEPKGTHWGATVAAPVFREAARKAMWHMKVEPDDVSAPAPDPVASEERPGHRETSEPGQRRPGLGG